MNDPPDRRDLVLDSIRIGIVEVQPGRLSLLNRQVATQFHRDEVIRLGELNDRLETIEVIKTLFTER